MEKNKRFVILNNNKVVEVININWTEKQALDMNAIECSNENVLPEWILIDDIFYPPKPSEYYIPVNGAWILDSNLLLNHKKATLLKTVENLYDSEIKNGGFAINVTPDNKWMLPKNDSFDIYKDFYNKNKKPLYLFVRYSNENRDQSFVANSYFSIDKNSILPISFTLDGTCAYDKNSDNNEVCVDTSYLKLKSINYFLLDIIFKTITIKKQNDATYKDDLVKSIRKCSTLEELDNVEIKFRNIDDSDTDTNISGFNKILLLNTLHNPLYNRTDLPLFYYDKNNKIYVSKGVD